MLPSLPFFLVIFGTPFAVLAVIPGFLIWERLWRGRERGLSSLFLSRDGAGAIERRLRAARRAALVTLVAVFVLALAGVVRATAFAETGVPFDNILGVTGPAVALAGLLVLLAWPIPRPEGSPGTSARVPLSRPERWAVGGITGAGVLLAGLLVAAGVVSVPDPPSPHYRAFPQASVVRWSYTFDGFPKDIEYTMHGVTVPWPGWWYGVPILLTAVPLVLVALAVLGKIHRLAPAASHGEDADDAVRSLLGIVTVAITAAGLLMPLAYVAFLVGDVFSSVSLYPRPKLDTYGFLKPSGHTQPLYSAALLAQWSAPVLGFMALAWLWVGVFAVRQLGLGTRSARRVLTR